MCSSWVVMSLMCLCFICYRGGIYLLNEYDNIVLTDFGMTRDIYETDYYRKGGKGSFILLMHSFPIRDYLSISRHP